MRDRTLGHQGMILLGGLMVIMASCTGFTSEQSSPESVSPTPANSKNLESSQQTATTDPAATSDPAAAFQQAISETQQQNFESAINKLHTASQLYTQRNQDAEAYQSLALAMYLQDGKVRRDNLAQAWSPPRWLRSARCLGIEESLCDYSITWIKPDLSDNFAANSGGVLILEKEVNRLEKPNGGSVAVQAVVDTEIVPPLQPGESLLSICELNGKAASIAAIAQTEGYEDQPQYTQIRQAWQANLATETLEPISADGVACINQCPGGC
jgi:hypothetical protein